MAKNTTILAALGGMILLLSACVSVDTTGATTPRERPDRLEGQCDAMRAQSFVGRKASRQIGEELVLLTKASAFRWAPPDSALTMDYRPSRLTVGYDSDMNITSIQCG